MASKICRSSNSWRLVRYQQSHRRSATNMFSNSHNYWTTNHPEYYDARRSLAANYQCRSIAHYCTKTNWSTMMEKPAFFIFKRNFQSEGDYHRITDDTMETIQDVIEGALEDHGIEAEISYASGVLTMSLPPHGTYVINKQTPNQQIWWSSPFSGPRRYEYNDETEQWVFTRESSQSLGETLNEEFQQMYNLDLDLDV